MNLSYPITCNPQARRLREFGEWVVQRLPGLSGDKRVEYNYDQLGRLVHLKYQPASSSEDHYFWYEYDDLGRLQYVYSDDDPSQSGWTQEAGYSYVADGQLKQLTLGNAPAQTVDYAYEVQGWLDKINEGGLWSGDRFGLDLNYTFNGNISQQKWKQAGATNTNTLTYNYSYDQANRLTEACFGGATCNNDSYDMTYQYDNNGNLTFIKRYYDISFDTYDYLYTTGTNKLAWIEIDGDDDDKMRYYYDAN